jgi:NTE family protein
VGKVKRINLALQGGGAHGAFTWGVIDHLLSRDDVEIGWVSATSAGAVNAAALAAGLAEGGKAGARAKLHEVWEAIHKAGVPDFLKFNPLLFGWSRSSAAANMASLFSPYELNPLGIDPLRQLLERTIDFSKLRAASPVELLIAATDIGTGRARLFRRPEMTVDAILASACLPTLHHAVEIEGRSYWDGGFSANPDLVNLALESPIRDTLIVLLNALSSAVVPTGTQEIAGHTNRLTFNAPLLRDVEIIETVRECEGGALPRALMGRSRLSPLTRHRFHLIEAGRHTGGLPADSKHKPDWGLFTYLHGAGKIEAHRWMDGQIDEIGRRSTVDLKARFLTDLPRFPFVAGPAPRDAVASTTADADLAAGKPPAD